MIARKHFQATGKLTACPNKPHNFQVGRVIGSCQIATKSWAFLTDRDCLHTVFLSMHSVENLNGTVAHQLIIGRLMVTFAVRKKGTQP